MTPEAYSQLGLLAVIAVVLGVLVFSGLRFVSAARKNQARPRSAAGESPLMAVVLQEAIQKLRAQERAMTERAEASERLASGSNLACPTWAASSTCLV
jgi:hypothetical protein